MGPFAPSSRGALASLDKAAKLLISSNPTDFASCNLPNNTPSENGGGAAALVSSFINIDLACVDGSGCGAAEAASAFHSAQSKEEIRTRRLRNKSGSPKYQEYITGHQINKT